MMIDMDSLVQAAMRMSEERMYCSKSAMEELAGHLGNVAVGIQDNGRILADAELVSTVVPRYKHHP